MKTKTLFATTCVALIALGCTAALAETSVAEQDPVAEAQAFLSSPTSLAQATATAEAAAGGKVASIEYQTGEGGAPDLIMADIVLADGSEKIVAINPADGKVMNITLAENDQPGDEASGSVENGESGNEGSGENANN